MRWCRVIAGVLILLVIALPALLGAVGSLVVGTVAGRQNPVAEGRAPGTIAFEAVAGQSYTVALSAKAEGLLDVISGTETRGTMRQKYRVRDSDASQARCTITHPGGATKAIRGDRQASSTVFGTVYATVGRFDGQAGRTEIACRFDPPKDLLGTATETPLMVHEPSSLTAVGWGLLGLSLLTGGVGLLLILRGTVWRKGRA